MSGGLVLRLRPHERFIVNGVVLENGDRRTSLCVKSQNANILRIRDAMHPDEADTPVKRLYYIAQLAVLGEASADEASAQIRQGLDGLEAAFGASGGAEDIVAAREHVEAGRFYHVMRVMNRLAHHEAKLLMISAARKLDPPRARSA